MEIDYFRLTEAGERTVKGVLMGGSLVVCGWLNLRADASCSATGPHQGRWGLIRLVILG